MTVLRRLLLLTILLIAGVVAASGVDARPALSQALGGGPPPAGGGDQPPAGGGNQPPPQEARPTVNIHDAAGWEGGTLADLGAAGQVVFVVYLSEAVGEDVLVDVQTSSLSARGGVDYIDDADTVVIPAGQTSSTFAVQTVPDVIAEPDSLFEATLSNPSDGVDLGVTLASGQIKDDDRFHSALVPGPMGPEMAEFEVDPRTLRLSNGLTPIFLDLELGPLLRLPAEDAVVSPLVVPDAWAPPGLRDPQEGAAPAGRPEVVLATGEGFPDALASAPLQGARLGPRRNGPQSGGDFAGAASEGLGASFLATTPRDSLSEVTRQVLQTAPGARVRVLGGAAAVSDAVVAEVEAMGHEVVRTFGPTRIETATEIARLFPEADTAVLVRAYGPPGSSATDSAAFADAIAAGAWAADEGWVVLLTETERLSAATRAHLLDSAIERVVVVGGTAAVDDPVLEELVDLELGVERVAGVTRADTARRIAEARIAAAGPGGIDDMGVIVLDGFAETAWVAGFTAASAGASGDAVVLLSDGDGIPEQTRELLTGFRGAAALQPATAGRRFGACLSPAPACQQVREALGLPVGVVVTVSMPGSAAMPDPDGIAESDDLQPGGRLEVRAERLDPRATALTVEGDCLADGVSEPVDDQPTVSAALTLAEDPAWGLCVLDVTIEHELLRLVSALPVTVSPPTR